MSIRDGHFPNTDVGRDGSQKLPCCEGNDPSHIELSSEVWRGFHVQEG